MPKARMIHRERLASEVRRVDHERTPNTRPITDDGRSADVPLTRQLILVRKGTSEGPLRVELFNERGNRLLVTEWNEKGVRRKSIDLDGLTKGRYVIRVSGTGRSEVLRFRQE